jgi:hypothetical protein
VVRNDGGVNGFARSLRLPNLEASEMSELITWYAAIAIGRRDEGRIICDDDGAAERESAEAAIWLADQMARKPGYIASVAFSRTGSPATGQYGPAEGLTRVGSLRWRAKTQVWTGSDHRVLGGAVFTPYPGLMTLANIGDGSAT